MDTLFILYYSLNTGGVQTKIIDIINYLQKKRQNLRIILVLQEKQSICQEGNITNRRTTVLYYSDTFWSKIPLIFPLYIIGLTLIYKPKAILSFTLRDTVSAIWAKYICFTKHIKVVVSEDCSEPDGITQELNINFPRVRRLFFRLFYSKADTVCAVSSHIASTLIYKHHVPPSIITKIHHWYSPSHQITNVGHITKKFDAVFVGRLVKIKNVSFLLSATRKIISLFPNFKLCIVGSGPEEKKLKRFVKDNQLTRHVSFVGFSKKFEQYIAQSKIFVFPSQNEGVPLVLLEAMSNKLPIVCSDYPAAKEVVRHEYNGYIYHSEDEFVQYVGKLLREPNKRKQLGNNGHSLVIRKFNPTNIEAYIKALGI
jgi:glycosyltransferase involved in cell wall biosynthesis